MIAGMDEPWTRWSSIRIEERAARLAQVVRETPLVRLPSPDPRVSLRGKLENRQETGSFKARGAWNQVDQLTPAQRALGVVCASSGNHGKALAWAARRTGVPAVVCMPKNAYPNKIEACRAEGATVVLSDTREAADLECQARVAAGMVLVHPYDAERTVEGAGSAGVEIARQAPDAEVVVVCVGGGGLVSGVSLALRRAFGRRIVVLGAEPEGAPSLALGMAAGAPVRIEVRSKVQGLTPSHSGQINIDIARACLDGVVQLPDAEILAAQEELVRFGEVVEPAGAAACAVVRSGRLPSSLLDGRSAADPLRVVVVVSGGNPDPEQLASVRAKVAGGA
jgi:threonine dehydratase